MLKKIKLLYIAIAFLIPVNSFCQNDRKGSSEENTLSDSISYGEQAVIDLKEGALIVRLVSKSKKIDALKKLLENGTISKALYDNSVKQTLKDRAEENQKIASAFLENYSFSPVYITYDSSTNEIMNGEIDGIFLDENLDIDPTIKLTEEPVVFTRIGRTDLSNTSGMIGIVFQNQKFEDLDRPFPYFLRLYSLGNNLVGALENDTSIPEKRLNKLVNKWDKSLKRIYLDLTEKPSN